MRIYFPELLDERYEDLKLNGDELEAWVSDPVSIR